jgi:hypothetical protein
MSMFVLAPILLVAPTLTEVQSASAAVPGTYKLFYKWNQTKFGHSRIVLRANHTGSDAVGNPIEWSRSERSITFVIDGSATSGAIATYVGKVTTTGLCSRQRHCHMSNNVGASGEWYAEKALT